MFATHAPDFFQGELEICGKPFCDDGLLRERSGVRREKAFAWGANIIIQTI
jgi:hypothetical protein